MRDKTAMGSDDLLIEHSTRLLRVTINRPAQRNALTQNVMKKLAAALIEANDVPTLAAIVLTGAGDKAFCAGADLRSSDTPFQQEYGLTTPFADLLRATQEVRLPLIGRINGYCMAGAMGLAAACDIVVAAESARFGLPEVKVGLFPMQVLALLRDVIPKRRLTELCLTGETFSAEEALGYGLVNHIVPDASLDKTVDTLVSNLIAVSPSAIRRGKYALRAMAGMSFDEMIAFAETQVGPMSMTPDAVEGRTAFAEKRPPRWPSCQARASQAPGET
jgi:methylglutaconyl-CoA hydratase